MEARTGIALLHGASEFMIQVPPPFRTILGREHDMRSHQKAGLAVPGWLDRRRDRPDPHIAEIVSESRSMNARVPRSAAARAVSGLVNNRRRFAPRQAGGVGSFGLTFSFFVFLVTSRAFRLT
jgi:hypothetical protein